MNFIDASVRDLAGAAAQFRGYLVDSLGFDYLVDCRIGVEGERGKITVIGYDSFQKSSRYDEQVGQLVAAEEFKMEDDFDAACRLVWTRLKAAMPRDEREMRHGLRAMSGIIEHAPSYQSLVGKMLADRVLAVRDDVQKGLLEYQRPAAQAAAH